jgi:hypothetical protein
MVEVALHPLSVLVRARRIGIGKQLKPTSIVVLKYWFYVKSAHVTPKIGRGIANPDPAALNGGKIIVLKAMLRGRSNRLSIRLVLSEKVGRTYFSVVVQNEQQSI